MMYKVAILLIQTMELHMVFLQHLEQVLLLVDRIFSLFSVMLEFTVLNNAKLTDVTITLDKVAVNRINTVVDLVPIVCMMLVIMKVQVLILLKLVGLSMVTIFTEDNLVLIAQDILLLQMTVVDIIMELMDIITMNKYLITQQSNHQLKVVLQVKQLLELQMDQNIVIKVTSVKIPCIGQMTKLLQSHVAE